MSASSLPLETKLCRRCRHDVDMHGFSIDRSRTDGLQLWCKQCQRECRSAKRDYHRAKAREHYLRTKARNPNHGYEQHLKVRYGLTPSEYDALLESQGHRCASCKDGLSDHRKHIHVDHCHVTGLVRGILCRYCNVALGQLKDDPERVRALLTYIEGAA